MNFLEIPKTGGVLACFDNADLFCKRSVRL